MANSISSSSSTSIPCYRTTINDLPQHILIHILTFLYLPDAIRSSLVSRSFRNLWHFIPSLHFDIEEFYSRSTSTTPRCDHTRKLFAEFVTQTLKFRQPNPLTKLQLTFEYPNHVHKYNIQSWIRYAINLSVSELVVDFRNDIYYDKWGTDLDHEANKEADQFCEFYFDLSDIGKSRIKVLELYKCKIMLPPETNPIEFLSLKSITLVEALYIDVEDISDLVARCVNLEILTLAGIAFSTEEGLVIHSSTLKELNLYNCTNVDDDSDERLDLDICCPSLQKINIKGSELGKVINRDTSHLVKACIEFMPVLVEESYEETGERMLSYFTNITNIDVWDELLESKEVPAGCEQFASNVKHLELGCFYTEFDLVGITALLKLLPKLEILVLSNKDYDTINAQENLHRDYRKASTIFSMPCLKKLIMRRYQRTKMEKHFIKVFKKNGIVLDKIELLPPSNQIEYDKYERVE